MKNAGASIIAILVWIGGLQRALADEVVLQGGGKIVGKIRSEEADKISIEIPAGSISISRSLVVEVRRGPCALCEFYERDVKLKNSKDAQSYFEVAQWARAKGLERLARAKFQKTIELDTDHQGAREALGYRKHNGVWLTESEFMLATGHVRFRGQWVKKGERDTMLVQEKKEQERWRKNLEERKAAAQRRLEEELALYRDFSSWGKPGTTQSGYEYPYAYYVVAGYNVPGTWVVNPGPTPSYYYNTYANTYTSRTNTVVNNPPSPSWIPPGQLRRRGPPAGLPPGPPGR